jgi:cyclopropane fatty-acyl-phospholipid synthase-like methyltransferase
VTHNNPEKNLIDSKSKKVAVHYDSAQGRMSAVIYDGHLHLGYWDEETEGGSYAQASARLTKVMIDKTAISPGGRFCDFGCGVGGPAIALTQARDCFVDGLTISAFQQEEATARARAAGLSTRLTFELGDVLANPLAPESYDGGWFFESIFHMGHRAALASAHRVLKPGAQLLIADLTLKRDVEPDFPDYGKRWIAADFVSVSDYPALLDEAGFDLVAVEDVTLHVMRPLASKTAETLAAHRAEIAAALTNDAVAQALDSYQRMSDNLDYVLVTARRR